MDDFALELSPEGVRASYYAVCEAIRLWPGAPARPVEEQVVLRELKMVLFAMIMEMNIMAD
jgi:hypothetical protein